LALKGFSENGSIEFLGRKDTQVKIRGLRVELGEVEYQIRCSLQQDSNIAVEMVKAARGTAAPALAAFICVANAFKVEKETETLLIRDRANDSFTQMIPALRADLEANLPHHMVPTAFVPLRRMPLSTTGKTDRKTLKELIAGLSPEEFAAFSVTEGTRRPPETGIQRTLQELWCSLLHLPTAAVCLEDHWFRCGGDSVLAMRLVQLARGRDLPIAVNDVFQHPFLEDLAAVVFENGESHEILSQPLFPFALLPDVAVSDLLQEMYEQYGIEPISVQDVYPCTPFQEGLMALSMRHPNAYVAHFVFQVPSSVNLSRFRSAWEVVTEANAILRTRFVDTSLGTMQAVFGERLQWTEQTASSLETYLDKDKKVSVGYGQPLNRYAIVHDGLQTYFVWTSHHALYDGHSVSSILESVDAIYHGETPPSQISYNVFIQHLSKGSREESQNYWRSQLAGSQPSSFFLLPSAEKPHPSCQTRQRLPLCKRKGADITTATLLRAAWALLVGSYSNTTDVIFGSTVSGRTCSLPGIDLISGPTVATIPVRVQFDLENNIADYLLSIQQQASDMVPYEHDGLQNIKEWCPDDAASMAFQNLFIVQMPSPLQSTTQRLRVQPLSADLSEFFTYTINVECTLNPEDVEILAQYDPSIISANQMRRLLNQFGHLVQQMVSAPDYLRLEELQMVSPEDLDDLQRWNQYLTPPCSWTLHDAVSQAAQIYHHHQAVMASDGVLSYRDLDTLSTRLAHGLLDKGVRKNDRVLLCYDKTCTAVIAVLAVLKAGGTVVAINSQHPESRLQTIAKQAGACAAVCIKRYAGLCQTLVSNVVIFDEFSELTAPPRRLPLVSPSDVAFIYFTV
jgi:hypothetical protein